MPDAMPTESQNVYERIDMLKGQGDSNADDILELVKERGRVERVTQDNRCHSWRRPYVGASSSAPCWSRVGSKQRRKVDNALVRTPVVLGGDLDVTIAKVGRRLAAVEYPGKQQWL